MKYKVSLLPQSHKKRLNSKRKIEQIRVYALVVLIMLFGLLVVTMSIRAVANSKLSKLQRLNSEAMAEVAELEQYRQISADLENKVNLISQIQVQDPALYRFIVNIGNINAPGISLTSIECTEWKTARSCVISGTCATRTEYLAYLDALNAMENVTASTSSYLTGVGTDNGLAQFTINISVGGGAAVVVEESSQPDETAAAESETDVPTE